jgi:hypothetical protein
MRAPLITRPEGKDQESGQDLLDEITRCEHEQIRG